MSDTLINIFGLIIGWGLITLGGLLILRALFADRPRGRRRCPRCWYSMQAIPSLTCPECGRTSRKERRLFKTRRKYRRALVTVFLPILGLAALYTSGAARVGWVRSLPTSALVALCPLKLSDWDGSSTLNTPTTTAPTSTPAGTVLLPSFPSMPPGPPPPPPITGDWRQDVVDELLRRVENDQLWDWQAALLTDRLVQAAILAGNDLGVIDTRSVIDRHLLRAGGASSVRRRAVLKSLAASFPLRQDVIDFVDAQLQLLINPSWTPPVSAQPNSPTIIGPFIIAWTLSSATSFTQLFDALRAATPDAPAALDPAEWTKRSGILEKARSIQVTAASDRPISEFFQDIANQSGLGISVDWVTLAEIGVTRNLVIRAPFEPSGSVADLLDRGIDAAAQERRYYFHWAVGPRGIEITGPGLFADRSNRPIFPVVRVYDIRATPLPQLYGWRMQTYTFNGRLIVSADVGTHVAFETYIASLPFR
jgi:hypothetical protein